MQKLRLAAIAVVFFAASQLISFNGVKAGDLRPAVLGGGPANPFGGGRNPDGIHYLDGIPRLFAAPMASISASVPPPPRVGFSPVIASDAEFASHGQPPRPDSTAHPVAFANWQKIVAKQAYVAPAFGADSIFDGPEKLVEMQVANPDVSHAKTASNAMVGGAYVPEMVNSSNDIIS